MKKLMTLVAFSALTLGTAACSDFTFEAGDEYTTPYNQARTATHEQPAVIAPVVAAPAPAPVATEPEPAPAPIKKYVPKEKPAERIFKEAITK